MTEGRACPLQAFVVSCVFPGGKDGVVPLQRKTFCKWLCLSRRKGGEQAEQRCEEEGKSFHLQRVKNTGLLRKGSAFLDISYPLPFTFYPKVPLLQTPHGKILGHLEEIHYFCTRK